MGFACARFGADLREMRVCERLTVSSNRNVASVAAHPPDALKFALQHHQPLSCSQSVRVSAPGDWLTLA